MRRQASQKKPHRILGCAATLIAVTLVSAVFFLLYGALSQNGSSPDGAAAIGTPFPTAHSFEDIPLGLYLQLRLKDLTTPAGDDSDPVIFTVSPGELPADVAENLQAQGLIRDADLFVRMAKYTHAGSKIQAGEFVLTPKMTIFDIIESLQHARARTVDIIIRPGWRAEEIAEYVSLLGLTNVSKEQFLRAVTTGRSDYIFLRDRPKGSSTSLEGFLFPETYNVPYDVTIDGILSLIMSTFDSRLTDKTRDQVVASKMTFYEVLTLASIVEREAAVAEERPTIASVYLNRLKKKQPLQADPTVQYAMGFQVSSRQWWKSPVSLDEYQNVKSPYNTYLYPGLPPGPICSPSIASLMAVLEPAQTDYLFFLGKGDGSHAFARTFEEHQQNLVKYGYK